MKFSITIEVDDNVPNVEFCGINCKCLKNGTCNLFDETLEDQSDNKIDDIKNGTIVYEKVKNINAWKRCKKCIDKFYRFCDENKT